MFTPSGETVNLIDLYPSLARMGGGQAGSSQLSPREHQLEPACQVGGLSRSLSAHVRAQKIMKRGLHRCHVGASVPEAYLLVTLTAPDGVDLHTAWRKLLWRMRYRKQRYAYYAVKENGTRTGHPHLHVVFRVDWLNAEWLRRQWTLACGSPVENCWTHHDFVRSKSGLGKYLTKYLLKSAVDGLTRAYWYSADWMFRRWVAFSKAMWHVNSPLSTASLVSLRERVTPTLLTAMLLHAVKTSHSSGFYLGRLSKTATDLLRGFDVDMRGFNYAI